MSDVPSELKYTAEHEWIKIDGEEIIVGITDFAQNALTDVVWVELPEVGSKVSIMESYASVESVKSVSEIYAPIAGTVTEVEMEQTSVQLAYTTGGATISGSIHCWVMYTVE